MQPSEINNDYWTQRYRNNEAGWDLGDISTPLKEYIDQIDNKNCKILIPGAGNAYEGEYLWKTGFTNFYIMDISPVPLENIQKRIPDLPADRLIQEDFFTHQEKYDLILEQTFFCAIHPSQRSTYAENCHRLLNPGGKIAGVLFDCEFGNDFPPFGGNKEEYEKYFDDLFHIEVMERCYNSIKPRADRELFIILRKK
jgi:methyl halide transferase